MAEAKKKSDKKPEKSGGSGKGGSGKGIDAPNFSFYRALGPALGIWLPFLLLALFGLVHWPGPWLHGPQLRHAWNLTDATRLSLVIGGGGLAVCAFWILLPVANWLRSAPLERYRSGNKVAWFVPLLLATPMWLGLYLAFVGCLALGAYAAITGLLQLGVPELIRALVK